MVSSCLLMVSWRDSTNSGEGPELSVKGVLSGSSPDSSSGSSTHHLPFS